MLQRGEADAAIHLDHLEKPPQRDERFRWFQRTSPLSVMLFLNCCSGPFSSAGARLAANLAVDKDKLVREVFHGLAVPAGTVVGPAHLGMRSANIAPLPHDPSRARQLLDHLGGRRELTLRTPETMPERAPAISRFVADALTAVGFDVRIETESDRPEYARQIGRKEIGDLALFDSSPHSTYRILNDKISSAAKAVWWQGYDSPDAERLITCANRAVEPEDRESAYAACLGHLNANPPWLYLVHPVNLFAAKHDTARLALTSKGTLAVG
jgi:peptide/nickel transport system substrate-binding protein